MSFPSFQCCSIIQWICLNCDLGSVMILKMPCLCCFLVDVTKGFSLCGNTLKAWFKVVQLYVLCHSVPDYTGSQLSFFL